MKKPLVSVIIPAYNAAPHIVQTINSVLKQTYQQLEIIVVDDGSTDDTLVKLQQLDSEKIKVLPQANRGASSAKQLGLENACGDFIQYLDADDLLSTNKIEVQVEELLKQPHQVAVCSTVHFDTGQDHLMQQPSAYEDAFLYSTADVAAFLINLWGGNGKGGSMIQPNAFLIPISVAKAAGPWDTKLSPCPDEDGEYFCRVLLSSKGIRYTDGVLNYYRKFPNKKSLSSLKSHQSLVNSYQSVVSKKNWLFKHNDGEKAKLAIARQLISVAIDAYPSYFSLYKKIHNEVKSLGKYSYAPISGGPVTRKLSTTVGWKFARLFQYYLDKTRIP